MRAPGRREIGHGALAERALLPVYRRKKTSPTYRVVSEIPTVPPHGGQAPRYVNDAEFPSPSPSASGNGPDWKETKCVSDLTFRH